MRIVISTATWYAEDEIRSAAFERDVLNTAPGNDIVFVPKSGNLLSEIAEATVFFPLSGHNFTEQVLDAAPLLEWVHLASAGVDHALYPSLMNRPITMTNSAGVYAIPIAEHVLAMMLALSRRIMEIVRQQGDHSYTGLRGEELNGTTVVIVGLGGIGVQVAALCSAFGARVMGTRRTPREPIEHVERIVAASKLDELLPLADWLILCAPLTPDTIGLLGEREFGLMKPGARVVNIARGGLIREDALLTALQSGRLAGAALDVFATEPLPQNSPLWDAPNLLVSPHSAGSSPNSLQRTLDLFTQNLRRYVNGEPLLNVVDKRAGY